MGKLSKVILMLLRSSASAPSAAHIAASTAFRASFLVFMA